MESFTGQYRSAFALLLHTALLLARYCERHLKHKSSDVVALLKVRLPVDQLLLLQVWSHVCHLDVCILGVQVFRVDLQRKQVVARSQNYNLEIQPCHILVINKVSPAQSPGSSLHSPVQTCQSRA